VGHALLGQICRDLMIAEFRHAEVHGIAEGDTAAEAFLVAAGADRARSYRILARPLGA
jgi:AICAR transformylase/IMP cyclohydrolase PurH